MGVRCGYRGPRRCSQHGRFARKPCSYVCRKLERRWKGGRKVHTERSTQSLKWGPLDEGSHTLLVGWGCESFTQIPEYRKKKDGKKARAVPVNSDARVNFSLIPPCFRRVMVWVQGEEVCVEVVGGHSQFEANEANVIFNRRNLLC